MTKGPRDLLLSCMSFQPQIHGDETQVDLVVQGKLIDRLMPQEDDARLMIINKPEAFINNRSPA